MKYKDSAGIFTHAHNDYIEALFELGYIGFSLLVLIILNFFWGFIRMVKDRELVMLFACVLAYLICIVGVFASHIAVSGMWFVLFFGLYLSKRREILNG